MKNDRLAGFCQQFWCTIAAALTFLCTTQTAMAENDRLVIDDRTSADYRTTSGGEWRLVTDGVMGGLSTGRLEIDVVEDRNCLRLTGDVNLNNNGGFVQATLDVPVSIVQNIKNYSGVMLEVHGNNEPYNLHLRTDDNRLPWQSYRFTFIAVPEWRLLEIPFEEFVPYRTDKAFRPDVLERLGVVAIGREFKASLCFRNLALYQ